MSYETWSAEYYPVPASRATRSDKEALEHSKLKWTGLLQENLQAHDISIINNAVAGILRVDGSSCVLCVLYVENDCRDCPLYKAGDNKPCDFEIDSPFQIWVHHKNAQPMLDLINLAIAEEQQDES